MRRAERALRRPARPPAAGRPPNASSSRPALRRTSAAAECPARAGPSWSCRRRAGRRQQVVAAGAGNFERAPGEELPADVGQVGASANPREAAGGGGSGRGGTRDGLLSACDGVGERRDRETSSGRRRSPLRWRSAPAAACRRRRRAWPPRQSAARPARDGSSRRATARRAARDRRCAAARQTLRGEDAERDRKIEGRAGLADVGRREVDGDAMGRKLEAGIADCAAYAVAAFADAGVGQADHREHRHAERHVHLDVHGEGVDAEDRRRPKARQHAGNRSAANGVARSGTAFSMT